MEGLKNIPLDAKIYVAGHRGMVGSAIVRRLREMGYLNLLTRRSGELDLTRQADVEAFFAQERPDYVIDAAAKVGGILANDTYRAQFIYENTLIQCNLIHSAHQTGVKKLLFLGSSCIYPKYADQPMSERALLTGLLEPTNEPYAIAKISGIKMCENYFRQYGDNFVSVMPTNLYGPNDNFDLESSHVLPALLRKFHEAKVSASPTVTVWGTGKVKREFLHVDDMADACMFVMGQVDAARLYDELGVSHINVGTGEDVTIDELARTIGWIVGYSGEVVFDSGKPDGTPRKLLDMSLLHSLGWHHRISLEEGLRRTYDWFKTNWVPGTSTSTKSTKTD